jgi:hypothetical protein
VELEDGIPGILVYDPDNGARLELIGKFKGSRGLGFRIPTIVGYMTNREEVTLVDCWELPESEPDNGGDGRQTFSVSVVLLGTYRKQVSDIRLYNLSLEIDGLTEWIDPAGVHRNVSREGKSLEFTVATQPFETVDIEISEDFKICLGARTGFGKGSKYLAQLEQGIFVSGYHIRSPWLFDFIGHMQHFERFLALAMRRQPAVIEMTSMDDSSDLVGGNRHWTVRILYQPEVELSRDAPPTFLFSRQDLGEAFPNCIATWYRNADKLGPVYDLYYAAVAAKVSPDVKFINLVQALETLHNRNAYPTDASEGNRKADIEQVMAAYPKLKWVREAMQRYLQPTFKMRLKHLLGRYPDLMTPLIKDPNRFLNAVRDSRNYYTHYTESLRTEALAGMALLSMTERVQVLLEASLLETMGLAPEAIAELFKKERFVKLPDLT